MMPAGKMEETQQNHRHIEKRLRQPVEMYIAMLQNLGHSGKR